MRNLISSRWNESEGILYFWREIVAQQKSQKVALSISQSKNALPVTFSVEGT
jgi:hypothetical protein